MQLVGMRLRNFRAYKEQEQLRFHSLTALVGRNDVGKSSIFDALAIFFEHESVKIEASDRCVHNPAEQDIEITCVFSSLPAELVIDQLVKTTLGDEYLLNVKGELEILKRYSGEKLKPEIFAVANHPTEEPLKDLLQKKNQDLKKLADNLGVTGDRRSNVSSDHRFVERRRKSS
jgi:putative ATP-dependent endonuclease of the OLD family